MRRAAIEKQRTENVWREHNKLNHASYWSRQNPCICDQQVNRFRKGQKKMGCGKGSRCMFCANPRTRGELTIQELRQRDRELDQRQALPIAPRP